jgi:outer membrane lipoprotein-sorting protein
MPFFPLRARLYLALTLLTAASLAHAAPTATEVVERADTMLWGKTLNAEFNMTIVTPAWQRSLVLKVWMDRPAQSFLRVTAPAKDAGISSLRIGTEMWNYLPAIERTVKIPPSLMLQPWLGSDFTYDDLVRESSIVTDYTHKMLDTPNGGSGRYVVEALPKPEAAVVWGKIVYEVSADFVPLKQDFFDEKGRHLRTLTYSEARRFDGHDVPTRWEMKSLDKPGKSTVIQIRSAAYDRRSDPAVYTMRNLTGKD